MEKCLNLARIHALTLSDLRDVGEVIDIGTARGCYRLAQIFTDGLELQLVREKLPTSLWRRIIRQEEIVIRKRIEIDPINATRLFMVGLTLELESSTTTIDVELLLLLAAGISQAYRYGILRPNYPENYPDPSKTAPVLQFGNLQDKELWLYGAELALLALEHPLLALDPNSETGLHYYFLHIIALQVYPTEKDVAIKFWKRILEIDDYLIGNDLGMVREEGVEIVRCARKRLHTLLPLAIDFRKIKRGKSTPMLRNGDDSGYHSLASSDEDIGKGKGKEREEDLNFISDYYPSPPPTPILPNSAAQFPPRPRKVESSTAPRPKMIKRVKSTTSLSTVAPSFIVSSASSSNPFSKSVDSSGSVIPPLPEKNWKELRKVISFETMSRFKLLMREEELNAINSLKHILKDSADQIDDYYNFKSEEEVEELSMLPETTRWNSIDSEINSNESPKERPKNLKKMRSFFDPTTKRSAPIKRATTPPPSTLVITHTPPTPDKLTSSLPLPKRSNSILGLDKIFLALEQNSLLGFSNTCHSCGKNSIDLPCCPGCGRNYCSRECRIGKLNRGGNGVKHICFGDKRVVKKRKSLRKVGEGERRERGDKIQF